MAHHPSGGTSIAGGSAMGSMAAMQETRDRAWDLSFGYSLALQSAQAPPKQARVLKAFGNVVNHRLALGLGYGRGAWGVGVQLPFGVSVRSQEGLARPQVWGLGDLRLFGRRTWALRRGSKPLYLLGRVGVVFPTGRYRQQDFIEASYLEPQGQSGGLSIRRVQAQAGLGGGVFAGMASVSMSQRWHARSRWILMFDAALPLSKTSQGHRWGADLQARALMDLSGPKGKLTGFLGPDFLYHTADRFGAPSSQAGQAAQELDLKLSGRQRWGLRVGASLRFAPHWSCSVEGVVGLWQQAEAGALRETMQALGACRWAFGGSAAG